MGKTQNTSPLIGTTLSFEKAKIHDDLYVVKQKTTTKVLGYVNRHPQEQCWFWIRGIKLSDLQFDCLDDAVNDLINFNLVNSLDAKANAAGVLHNPNFVKGL